MLLGFLQVTKKKYMDNEASETGANSLLGIGVLGQMK